jgi:hypothetical protein
LDIGFRSHPAEIRNAGSKSRMRTTSACITKAYYHARIRSVTEIRAKQALWDCYESVICIDE